MQFRLQTLFVVTAVSAVAFAALFAPPHWIGMFAIYLSYFLLAGAAISGIVFHRGTWQAFFIGLAPYVVIGSLTIMSQHIDQWSFYNMMIGRAPNPIDEQIFYKTLISIPLLLGVASGGIAVAVRWWAKSIQQRNE